MTLIEILLALYGKAAGERAKMLHDLGVDDAVARAVQSSFDDVGCFVDADGGRINIQVL